ncbi:MAG: hypothetical protein ACP5P4_12765 [Steroidobacteraceae bacterium]
MSTERLPSSVLERRFVPVRWGGRGVVRVFAARASRAHGADGPIRPFSHPEPVRLSPSPGSLRGYAAQRALRMRMRVRMLASRAPVRWGLDALIFADDDQRQGFTLERPT